MENFVRDYGTGNQIPDPPAFVNYNMPDAIPSSSSRRTTHPAQFVRATQRELPLQNSAKPDSEEPVVNTAGIGAGGGRRSELYTEPPDLTRRPTQSRAQAQQAVYANKVSNNQPAYSVGPSAPGPTGQPPQRKPTYSSQAPSQTSQIPRIPQDPHAETIDPTAETYIKVGNNAYKVDLSKDPQQQDRTKAPSPSIRSNASSPVKPIGNGSATVDPLAKQLEELQNAVSSTGSIRRNTLNRPTMATQVQEQRPSSRPRTSPGPSTLSPPATSTSLAGGSNSQSTSPGPVRDYRNSAEVVVGTHPAAAAAVAASRPASPNPPTAAFMVPRPATPSGSEVVQEVLADYHQSLPGERKSLSRQGSRRGSFSTQPGQQNLSGPPQHQSNLNQGQSLARPPSTGHAGIGAHGSRSNSPQPQSRGPSPAPGSVINSYIAPPPQGVVRAPSPNAVGIVLDPSGRVLHDDMAHGYQQQPQHRLQQQRPGPPQQQQIQPQYNPPVVPQQQQQQQQARRSSYMSVPPPQQQAYAVTPPPPTLYQAPPPQAQASYIQPPPVQPSYTPSPVLYQPAPVPQQQQTTYQMTPAQAGPFSGGVNGVGVGRGAPGYYQPQQQQLAPVQQPQQQRQLQPQQQQLQPQQRLQQPQQQQLQPQQQQRQGGYHPQQQVGYQDPSPVGRSSSPQPPAPGQTTEDGDQILFYGIFTVFLLSAFDD